jgi:hypothetical protein
MKSFIRKTTLFSLLGMLTLLAGCDLFNDLGTVSFDSTLSEEIVVSESSTGTNVANSKTIVLDATTDPDINQYKDKIKGIKVNKISYQVVSFSATDPVILSGTMAFGESTTSSPTVIAAVTSLNLKEAFLNGTVYDLTVPQADIDKISALLKDDKAVKIYLNSTLSKTPVSFTIEIILNVTVEADALK